MPMLIESIPQLTTPIITNSKKKSTFEAFLRLSVPSIMSSPNLHSASPSSFDEITVKAAKITIDGIMTIDPKNFWA